MQLTSKPTYISALQYAYCVRFKTQIFLAEDYILGVGLPDLTNKNIGHQQNVAWDIAWDILLLKNYLLLI